jgi:hypothetical protein
MMAFTLYNGGRPLFENSNNMLSFKQNVEQVSWVVKGIVVSLMNIAGVAFI